MHNFLYSSNGQFEWKVVEKLKKRLNIGCEETVKFKYIGVGIRQEKDKVVMSQQHYSRSIYYRDEEVHSRMNMNRRRTIFI